MENFSRHSPLQLQSRAIDERTTPNAGFNIPANYPANHPQAGNAHPQAGEKNLPVLTTHFAGIWREMIHSGLITVPKDDVDVHFVGKGKGKGKGKGEKGDGWGRSKGGRGYGNERPKPVRPMDEKVCCYKCGGLGHVAKIKCEDGSYMYCATATGISDEILNAIKYPHIPSAQERRNGQTAQAAQVAEEEEQPAADDVEDDESDADSKYDAQFAAIEGDENNYHEW